MFVCKFNSLLNVKLSFSGNAALRGSNVRISLDEKSLTKDVTNLVMMAYLDSITNLTFFTDDVLVHQYFQFTTDVSEIFSTLFNV